VTFVCRKAWSGNVPRDNMTESKPALHVTSGDQKCAKDAHCSMKRLHDHHGRSEIDARDRAQTGSNQVPRRGHTSSSRGSDFRHRQEHCTFRFCAIGRHTSASVKTQEPTGPSPGLGSPCEELPTGPSPGLGLPFQQGSSGPSASVGFAARR
jgi:hypothetical protein